MRSSADQPVLVRAVTASQFSSQSWLKSVSLKCSASESTPAAFTENSNALLPSARVSRMTVTLSASTHRSRRVRRATTSTASGQSMPTNTFSSS